MSLKRVVLALLALTFVCVAPVLAAAETRSLKLYYIHTKEKAEIVFKRNGRYDQAGLNKLNRFLRDWRRNEPTKMDPRLFDLVWEVYRQSGARDYIHVVSAYRSPATNAMLRRTRGGQADKSQHMLGRAMDFFIPGVKLSKLRSIAMKLQGGGVGYYPKSGSPFVHLDVAGVRAWPRMSRQELVQLFPDGKTLHLPPDGKPLPGYQAALADYKRRGGAVRSAPGGNTTDSKKGGGLLAALFGGEQEDDEAETAAAAPVPAPKVATPAPAPQPEAAAPVIVAAAEPQPPALPQLPVRGAPIPVARPGTQAAPVAVAALVPPAPVLPAQAEVEAFAAAAAAEIPPAPPAIVDLARIKAPVPTLLAERAAPAVAKPTEVAALSAETVAAAASAIPAPLSRSELGTVAPAETAAAAPAPVDVASVAPQLPSDQDFVPLPIRRPGSQLTNAFPEAPVSDIAVAALEPVKVDRAGRPAATVQVSPRKGSRPVAATVPQPKPAKTAEPALNELMISKWALSRDRARTVASSAGKTQQFAVSQLRAAPKVVYANGFAPDGKVLPHNQFTGSAVNFISVARFGD